MTDMLASEMFRIAMAPLDFVTDVEVKELSIDIRTIS